MKYVLILLWIMASVAGIAVVYYSSRVTTILAPDGPIPPESRIITGDIWTADPQLRLTPGEAIMCGSRCEQCGHLQRFWVGCEDE